MIMTTHGYPLDLKRLWNHDLMSSMDSSSVKRKMILLKFYFSNVTLKFYYVNTIMSFN